MVPTLIIPRWQRLHKCKAPHTFFTSTDAGGRKMRGGVLGLALVGLSMTSNDSLAALGTLLLGLYPAPFIELAQRAVTVFGG